MIDFLAGTVTLAYLVAALFFLRFWNKTSDRLFLAFAFAFVLFALNQALGVLLAVYSEPTSFIYVLRIAGFILIAMAIVDKNLSSGRRSR
jgi:hypothetical protein